MLRTCRHLRRSFAVGMAALTMLSAAATAQINISGTIADGSGGPLLSGQVYHATSSLTVALAQTLTVQSGAIVKFANGAQLSVSGTLDVNGSTGSRVKFSSITDDAAGGDTNGDGGATIPVPGAWRGVLVNAGATVHLDDTDILYTGNAGFSAVHVNGSGTTISMDGCAISDVSADAFELAGQSFASLSVANSSFDNSGGYAVSAVRLELLPSFSNNTASGCSSGDYLQIANGNVAASTNQVITLDQLINGVLVMHTSVTIPLTSSLSLPAGLLVKMFNGAQMSISGTLTGNGTSLSPLLITSINDDSLGGDTNKNGGATVAVPGAWRGLLVNAGGVLDLQDATVLYTGNAGFSAVHVNGSGTDITLSDCIFRDASVDAMEMAGQSFSALSVSGCSFLDGGGFAVNGVRLDLLPNFSSNTASGNTSGDYLKISNGTLSGSTNLAVTLDQLLNGVLVMHTSVTVPSGGSLTLPEGLVAKMVNGSQFSVSGTMVCNGTSGSPIAITSINDDAILGDTNKNGGATTAIPGAWRGVLLNASGTLTMTDTELAYTGNAGFSAVHINGTATNLSLTDCLLRDCSADGLELAGQTFASMSVSGCAFIDNGQLAVQGARLDVLPGFSANTATGNTTGDYINIANGTTLPGLQTVSLDQLLNDVLVMATSSTIASGNTLQILAGVNVKMANGSQWSVNGTFDVDGSGQDPVTFTSINDDDILGDTNKNAGATVPVPGAWRGVLVNPNGTLDLDHALIRYCGNSGFAAVHINTATAEVRLDAVRTEHASSDGFFLQDAEWVRDCVAWSCGRDGFSLPNNTYDLMRCTAVANGRYGVNKGVSHTGMIFSTVSWNNTVANYDGLIPGELLSSLGDATLAGGNGNVNTDPLFVDEVNGNLRLTASSICVDNGDPVDAPSGFDLSNFPRLLDGKLNFFRRVDMGAYEFGHIEQTVTGVVSPGNTINLNLTGTAGMTTYVFLGVATLELSFKTFGPLTVDVSQPSIIFNWLPLPSSVPLAIPVDFPVGIPVYAQSLGLDGVTSFDPGNMSNPLTIIAE